MYRQHIWSGSNVSPPPHVPPFLHIPLLLTHLYNVYPEIYPPSQVSRSLSFISFYHLSSSFTILFPLVLYFIHPFSVLIYSLHIHPFSVLIYPLHINLFSVLIYPRHINIFSILIHPLYIQPFSFLIYPLHTNFFSVLIYTYLSNT